MTYLYYSSKTFNQKLFQNVKLWDCVAILSFGVVNREKGYLRIRFPILRFKPLIMFRYCKPGPFKEVQFQVLAGPPFCHLPWHICIYNHRLECYSNWISFSKLSKLSGPKTLSTGPCPQEGRVLQSVGWIVAAAECIRGVVAIKNGHSAAPD